MSDSHFISAMMIFTKYLRMIFFRFSKFDFEYFTSTCKKDCNFFFRNANIFLGHYIHLRRFWPYFSVFVNDSSGFFFFEKFDNNIWGKFKEESQKVELTNNSIWTLFRQFYSTHFMYFKNIFFRIAISIYPVWKSWWKWKVWRRGTISCASVSTNKSYISLRGLCSHSRPLHFIYEKK